MSHALTLQSIEPVTHDVFKLRFDKPGGLAIKPGQAVDMAIDKDEWREEKRPFTPTSLPSDGYLEFTIKSYPEHDGVTEQIAKLQPGDKVLVDEPWGAINDEGKGWFIAGGAGVTPMIAILRKLLEDDGTLEGCELIFSNSTEADIIRREDFEQMKGLTTYFTVTDQTTADVHTGKIDKTLLNERIEPGKGKCYVCGPDGMIDDIVLALKEIGVSEDDIVIEQFD
ncbi:FAD-binding oxidoreductase [Henriciella marina]|uniref:FAD-binding oxidoreductase n=1 Tax=Henriciella marina TaxID=453851 RepID=UPI00036D4DE0|nr:FAD-binding oxidoreductase [Henriciella marina]